MFIDDSMVLSKKIEVTLNCLRIRQLDVIFHMKWIDETPTCFNQLQKNWKDMCILWCIQY